jgi:hypothetical protein
MDRRSLRTEKREQLCVYLVVGVDFVELANHKGLGDLWEARNEVGQSDGVGWLGWPARRAVACIRRLQGLVRHTRMVTAR